MTSEHDLQAADKQEVSTAAEQTRTGLAFVPVVDIFETPEGLTLLADLPGVEADDLEIDLRENVLSLTGPVTNPEQEGEEDVVREFRFGTFVRQFTLSDVIDQTRIEAKLVDGVLRLELPRVEKAKPRQINVKTG